jgi:hypothetical protein
VKVKLGGDEPSVSDARTETEKPAAVFVFRLTVMVPMSPCVALNVQDSDISPDADVVLGSVGVQAILLPENPVDEMESSVICLEAIVTETLFLK